jgi:hypothetical protein
MKIEATTQGEVSNEADATQAKLRIAKSKPVIAKFVKSNHPSRIVDAKASYEELYKAAMDRKDVEYLSPFAVLKRKLWGCS